MFNKEVAIPGRQAVPRSPLTLACRAGFLHVRIVVSTFLAPRALSVLVRE